MQALEGPLGRHETLKNAGQIERWVSWSMVADGRGGDTKAQGIVRFEKSWTAACVAAAPPGRILHDLRCSAVRAFVRRGISEYTAMNVCRHKTPAAFRRNDIVSSEGLQEAARKLDARQEASARTRSAKAR
jgi:hypothetical protein